MNRRPAMRTVGEIIRDRRESLGLTLDAVAKEAGLTKSYLSMVENHKVNNPPSKKALAGIERALAIGKGDLLRAGDWEKTPDELRERLEKAEGQVQRTRDLAKWLKENAKGRGLDKA